MIMQETITTLQYMKKNSQFYIQKMLRASLQFFPPGLILKLAKVQYAGLDDSI